MHYEQNEGPEVESRCEAFISDEISPFLEEHFRVYSIPTWLTTKARDYFLKHSRTASAEGFIDFEAQKDPAFVSQLHCLGQTPDRVYLSEVYPSGRFNERESLSASGERSLMKFHLTSHEDLFTNPFMGFDEFFSEYIVFEAEDDYELAVLRLKPYKEWDSTDVQNFRKGVVIHFTKIFEALTPEEGLDFQEYLQGFIDHFSEDQKGMTRFITPYMSNALEESIWFCQKMLLSTQQIEDFSECAQRVGIRYIVSEKNRQRNHSTKYPVDKFDREKASYFEHFMGVIRLALGYIQSLELHAEFSESDFFNLLKARPDYLLEVIYTALLHDVIEDQEFSEEAVNLMLQEANLAPPLVDQIMKNLDLLNSKRLDENGVRVSTEVYIEEIMNNPVTKIVKFADVIHNNKDVHKNSKFDENGEIKPRWLEKRTHYGPLIENCMNLSLYMRPKEPVAILESSPELMRIEGWRSLVRPSQKDEIFQQLSGPTRKKVAVSLAT